MAKCCASQTQSFGSVTVSFAAIPAKLLSSGNEPVTRTSTRPLPNGVLKMFVAVPPAPASPTVIPVVAAGFGAPLSSVAVSEAMSIQIARNWCFASGTPWFGVAAFSTTSLITASPGFSDTMSVA